MKKIYQYLLSVRLTRSLLLSLFLLGAIQTVQAQLYSAYNLSGTNESPSNTSPGTGNVYVNIEGNFMRVQATFSGLIGTTTAAHIHAPTAVAGAGTVGVATTTPTFTGFPTGVTSGTYDHIFDMTQSGSYNPTFITANGGTPASAFAALKAAMDNGKAYFNIHTTFVGSGEIRAFLVPCSSITVSIPDAYALPTGTLPNTVYPAYPPASSITLETNVIGGTAPYTYLWSHDGSTIASVTVSPIYSYNYYVIVYDKDGCPSSGGYKYIDVVDVAAGKKGDKIIVCHKGGKSLEIDATSVADHLAHGDMLGSCSLLPGGVSLRQGITEEDTEEFSVVAFPNPSLTHFDLKISGGTVNNVQVRVYDLLGREVESIKTVEPDQALRLGMGYTPGLYIVEIAKGAQKRTLRMLKGK